MRTHRATLHAGLLALLASSLAPAQTLFVDRNSNCPLFQHTGSKECISFGSGIGPFMLVSEAVRFNHKDRQAPPAPLGATLVIRAGNYPEAVLFNKPMQIRAQGTVTIGPAGPRLPFDLFSDKLDVNGLPLNPKWQHQRVDHPPLSNPRECPGRRDGKFPDPGVAPCTNQFTYFNKGVGCEAHVQWLAATYTGLACWDKFDDEDNDFNIDLLPDDGAGLTDVSPLKLHGELRGDETIDNMTLPFWVEFRDAAEHGRDLRARTMIDGSPAIMTGLIGMDCNHDCITEIHPIWALAMNVAPSVTNDTWELFLNNAGFGGSCLGDLDQEFADFSRNQYTFRLPWKPGALAVNVRQSFESFKTSQTQSVESIRDVGVFVTLPLDSPRKDGPMWAGELHLEWIGPQVSAGVRSPEQCRFALKDVVK